MERYFIDRNCLTNIHSFRHRFRDSLRSLGQSPDLHIYEIDGETLYFSKHGPSLDFVISVIDFYNKLQSNLLKKIFVTEIIERGRHYPFWHYGVMETSLYKEQVAAVYDKFVHAFDLRGSCA